VGQQKKPRKAAFLLRGLRRRIPGREACPDGMNEVKAHREAQVGQQIKILFFSQPLKINGYERFLFLQVFKMYARTP